MFLIPFIVLGLIILLRREVKSVIISLNILEQYRLVGHDASKVVTRSIVTAIYESVALTILAAICIVVIIF